MKMKITRRLSLLVCAISYVFVCLRAQDELSSIDNVPSAQSSITREARPDPIRQSETIDGNSLSSRGASSVDLDEVGAASALDANAADDATIDTLTSSRGQTRAALKTTKPYIDNDMPDQQSSKSSSDIDLGRAGGLDVENARESFRPDGKSQYSKQVRMDVC